jgi:1,5-anhydro-D-fructose reductase (1,5-anhydro-D-mannitol-forming)
MRIGIASFAHLHAAAYTRILTGTDGIEVLIADPDRAPGEDRREQAWQRAQSAGAVPLPGYGELFAAGLDGLIVCTENAAHRDLVIRAAHAGIPVLCEKPLATTMADAREMVTACERRGVPLMMAYPVRFSPAVAGLRRAVADGALGALQACVGRNNGRIPLGGRSWFTDPARAGGGALMDHVVHVADILLMLLASPPVQVYAQANRIFHGGTVPVETGGILAVTFGNGVAATIDFSWSRPDSYPTWGGLTLELAGDQGTLAADMFGPRLTGFSDDAGPVWISLADDLDRLMLEEFLAAIRDGRPPVPDGQAGLATLEIVLAGYESARTGQPVPVGPGAGAGGAAR